MFAVKDKILNDIIFKTLPFRVYDHLFFVTDTFYYEKYCSFCTRFHIKGKTLSHFLNQKMTLPVIFSPKELLSDNVFVTNLSLFVHYHGLVHSTRNKNF